MGTIKFKILNDYGSLGGSDSTYFRFIDWNGFEKYDIRRWSEDGTEPFKGIKSFIFLWVLMVHSGFPLFSPASAIRRNIPHHRWIPYLVYHIILPSQLVRSIIDYIERAREFCAQIRTAVKKKR